MLEQPWKKHHGLEVASSGLLKSSVLEQASDYPTPSWNPEELGQGHRQKPTVKDLGEQAREFDFP